MADQENFEKLLAKLDLLQKKQNDFSREMHELKQEIYRLQPQPLFKQQEKYSSESPTLESNPSVTSLPVEENKLYSEFPRKKSDIEKFIGENLINKIGILITILGIGIGAKYSIENDLISPLGRIILGYSAGIILLSFGLKLRKSYKNFSSVLVSGAISVMYFITYIAFSFYALFPQFVAFALMLVFTFLTVFTALRYNRQVIAHIGMVGAYAIPFLLSSGTGRAEILFTYMAIINGGILAIAFKKYWKPLFYLAFSLTWFILLVWLYDEYGPKSAFLPGFIFSTLFFAIFYFTFLVYRLLNKEEYNRGDVFLLLANSFVYYAVVYYILNVSDEREQYLGLFTLGTAVLHFGVSLVLYQRRIADKGLLFLITGIALIFLTMAIPVQLDANWVTLLWSGEAALLFWIGKTKNSKIYEKISYVVMVLAFVSLLEDWSNFYSIYNITEETGRIIPIFNTGFFTSLMFIAAFGFKTWILRKYKTGSALKSYQAIEDLVSYAVPAVFIFSIYYSIRLEIEAYWQQRFIASGAEFMPADEQEIVVYQNYDLMSFQTIWIINYSLLFLAILSLLNFRRIRNYNLGLVLIFSSIICLLVFLTQGQINLADLRQNYLNRAMSEFYTTGDFHIWIRYVSIACAALLLVVIHKLVRENFMKKTFVKFFDIFLHISILSIASTELDTWIGLNNPQSSAKLGLSLLWGIYSLLLIGLGIRKNRKHLRIGAFVLFGITLVKLFAYDISNLDTLSKTIVFVCLGVLLLIISFLYNKYKNRISI